ncbi:MAG: thioredoxin fold domain-containing protein [Pseudomonadota bacterium]|nr:thioredoxin fold domain-containing protein [Pseudomonadota bacterium]
MRDPESVNLLPRYWIPLSIGGRIILASLLLVAVQVLVADEEKIGSFSGAKPTTHPTWFKDSFLDFEEDIAEAAAQGKRLVLYVYQSGCPYCNALVQHNFAQRDIAQTTQDYFDLVTINMWGDREVIQVGGQSFTEKTLAEALKVQFTPTLLFFNEAGKVVLRVNGYYPPDAFRAALEYARTHTNQSSSFNEFMSTLPSVNRESGSLHSEVFFVPPPFDLSARGGRPLAVFFEQSHCLECDTFHQKVLSQPIVRSQAEKLTAVQLDLWSDIPIVTPDGRSTTARNWARELDVGFAPTVVLFNASGAEVVRLEAAFQTFHTQGIFRYVLDQAYEQQPSFQRYLSMHADELREQGYDVDIWSYDRPVSRNGIAIVPD